MEILGADAAESRRLVGAAVDDGADRVVLAGGDGLVHIAIQALANTPAVMGLCPIGTGNDFAAGMGIPSDIEEAVAASLGAPTPVDLMRIGEIWGASVATAGFSADVNKRANSMRFPKGSSRYTVATLLELGRLDSRPYEVTIDGESFSVDATLITVANTGYFGGGMHITPSAHPDDGLLDVTLVGEVGRLELLAWFRKVFSGSHLDHGAVSVHRGRSVTIAGPDVHLWADGEPAPEGPTTIDAAPRALRLAGVTLPR